MSINLLLIMFLRFLLKILIKCFKLESIWKQRRMRIQFLPLKKKCLSRYLWKIRIQDQLRKLNFKEKNKNLLIVVTIEILFKYNPKRFNK